MREVHALCVKITQKKGVNQKISAIFKLA